MDVRSPGDVLDRRFGHIGSWAPSTSKEAFDSRPDMSDTRLRSILRNQFTYPDWSPATVYVGHNARTVYTAFSGIETRGIESVDALIIRRTFAVRFSRSDYPSFQTVLGQCFEQLPTRQEEP